MLDLMAASLLGGQRFDFGRGSLQQAIQITPDIVLDLFAQRGGSVSGGHHSAGGRAHRRWKKRRAAGRAR